MTDDSDSHEKSPENQGYGLLCDAAHNSKVGGTGPEPDSVSDNADNGLRKSPIESGAKSGALPSDFDQNGAPEDSELRLVIEAWPRLPAHVRADMLDMVRQATTGDE